MNCQSRDQFIAGMTNSDIRRELLSIPDLTLAMAISKAVALEHSFAESKLHEPSGVASASKLPSLPVHRAEERPSSQPHQSCKYCGGLHVPGAKHCPAAGHFAKVCMSKRSSHAKANMCEDIEEASV